MYGLNQKNDALWKRITESNAIVTAVSLHPYCLTLTKPWVTSRRSVSERKGFIVEISNKDGLRGFGDCSTMPEIGTETLSESESAGAALMDSLIGSTIEHGLQSLCLATGIPALCCAIETALLDLAAKCHSLPLCKFLSPSSDFTIPVNAMIGAVDAELSGRAMSAVDAGYKILKIKVGSADIENELTALNALCTGLPGHVRLRLDANGAWSMARAKHFIATMDNLPIDCLEEPLKSPSIDKLSALQRMCGFPIAVDESLATLPIDNVIDGQSVRRIVLKPAARGGLLPCLKLADRATRTGLDCVVTSALESPVGLLACCHLAAAIPGRCAHGLATGAWFAADRFAWPKPVNGFLTLANQPGLGINPVTDELVV